MRILSRASAVLALTMATLATVSAQSAPHRERINQAFSQLIPNIPGKKLEAIVVSYPPGTSTPAHRHPSSAFIVGYVLSGAIRSQVDDGPVQVFHAGQSWTEQPGAHHVVSENASKSRPAKLLAIFVVDAAAKDLTTLDHP